MVGAGWLLNVNVRMGEEESIVPSMLTFNIYMWRHAVSHSSDGRVSFAKDVITLTILIPPSVSARITSPIGRHLLEFYMGKSLGTKQLADCSGWNCSLVTKLKIFLAEFWLAISQSKALFPRVIKIKQVRNADELGLIFIPSKCLDEAFKF
jgi:hypothetical protein